MNEEGYKSYCHISPSLASVSAPERGRVRVISAPTPLKKIILYDRDNPVAHHFSKVIKTLIDERLGLIIKMITLLNFSFNINYC